MTRVINPDSAGKARTRLTKEIVLALRHLMRQQQVDDHSRDLAAFIVLALKDIHNTIDPSVLAWEKRGYWVKADRFRLEWEWTATLSQKLSQALFAGDWAAIASISSQVAQKLMKVQVSDRNRLGEPWVNAWQRFQQKMKDSAP
jgi:hypothetical protein